MKHRKRKRKAMPELWSRVPRWLFARVLKDSRRHRTTRSELVRTLLTTYY